MGHTEPAALFHQQTKQELAAIWMGTSSPIANVIIRKIIRIKFCVGKITDIFRPDAYEKLQLVLENRNIFVKPDEQTELA